MTDLYFISITKLPINILPRLGNVVKIRFYFGYKINILRYNGLKFGNYEIIQQHSRNLFFEQIETVFTAPPSLFLCSNVMIPNMLNQSAGKHDRGPLFFALFSFRLIRSRFAGSI